MSPAPELNSAIPLEPAVQAPPLSFAEMLDMLWRSFATGLCFACFGLGQLVLGLTLFPLMLVVVRKPLARRRLAKYAIHLSFKAFVFLMLITRVLDYKLKNIERLKRPGLLVFANHPSLIDAVFLISFMRQCDCVIKASLFNNPFIQFAAKGAGYIPNDDDFLKVVDAGKLSFSEGNSLLIFPEATRSQPGIPLNLRRGAAQLAIRSKRDMTPVTIRVGEHNIGKQSQWWKVPRKRVQYEFIVNDDIPIAPYIAPGVETATAARDLTDFLTEYFTKKTA